jgi:hypothetical protein
MRLPVRPVVLQIFFGFDFGASCAGASAARGAASDVPDAANKRLKTKVLIMKCSL